MESPDRNPACFALAKLNGGYSGYQLRFSRRKSVQIPELTESAGKNKEFNVVIPAADLVGPDF